MTETKVTVLGEPVAKERPRIGKNGNVYTPAATRAYETAVALIAKLRLPKYGKDAKLVVDLTFYCADRTKDLDNLCKSTLDGLQKAGTFRNDNQIIELHARKVVKAPEEQSRVEIKIGALAA
jgi:crossover junction endodeoxyribonuclease RusA